MSLLHIYDVSGYQPSAMRDCDVAFVKATEGATYVSGSFAAQWASAKNHASVRGAYHFARPEASSAVQQADHLLSVVKAVPGELLCLDLEASKLTQAATNAWAKAFGDRLREKAPGVKTVLYLGSGYAANETGRGLADHFDLWWYPQYPSAYQVTAETETARLVEIEEMRRALNRSHVDPGRVLISRSGSTWPIVVSPWLPSGITTGWSKPHIWQFTDNLQGWDASISALTLEQLAGGGGQTPPPQPVTEDQVSAGIISPGKGSEVPVSYPKGSKHAIGLVYDNSLSMPDVGVEAQPTGEVRVAFHLTDGTHQVVADVKVGVGVVDPKQPTKTFKTVVQIAAPANSDYVILVRLDDGKRPIGWDIS